MINNQSYLLKDRVSDEEFITIISSSKNARHALLSMGLFDTSCNYKKFKMRCKELNIIPEFNSNQTEEGLNLVPQKDIKENMSDDDFISFCGQANSRQNALCLMGLKPVEHNISWLKIKIDELHIDTSNWLGMGLKGVPHNWTNKTPIEEILIKNSTYLSTGHLKERLLNEGLLEYKCSECGINSWKDKPLSLQIDHKNGDSSDNRLENLCLLCPNCHSQTETYCGKKKKN